MGSINKVITGILLSGCGYVLAKDITIIEKSDSNKNSAIVIVDMQEQAKDKETVDPDLMLDFVYLTRREEMITNQRAVLDYGIARGIPVYVLEIPEYTPTIQPLAVGDVFYHPTNLAGGFHAQNRMRVTLEDELRRQDVDQLLVMGIYQSFCVFDFVINGVERGYSVLLANDLMADPMFLTRDPGIARGRYSRDPLITYKDNYTDLLPLL